jgi:hypothetical protein
MGRRAVGALPLLVAGLISAAHTPARAFFDDPSKTCAVHQLRDRKTVALDPENRRPPSDVSYRDLCNPALYDFTGYFRPGQYPDSTDVDCLRESSLPSQHAGWPRCTTAVTPSQGTPDFGYRYPIRSPSPGPDDPPLRIFQNPDLQDESGDWWRICATRGSRIVSDPVNDRAACPPDTEEVGLCVPSAHYYERVTEGTMRTPAARFYDFVLTHPDCSPGIGCENCNEADGCPDVCGHEVASAVLTCKALCHRYFGRLRFAMDLGKDAASVERSNWTVVDDLSTPAEELPAPIIRCPEYVPAPGIPGPDAALADTCILHLGYCNRPPGSDDGDQTCGMTPLQICVNNCGPPYSYYDAETPRCTRCSSGATCPDGAACPRSRLCCSSDQSLLRQDTPPWISKAGTNKPGRDQNNHWYLVSFGRPWNPNENLDNWLRSYAVNRDKERAPSNVCNDIVAKYCSVVVPRDNPPPYADRKRARCRETLIPGRDDGRNVTWSFPLPALDDLNGGPNAGLGGFCDHFFLGNFLCPNTCTAGGSDAGDNPLHRCAGEQDGELGGRKCPEKANYGPGHPGGATCCLNPPCAAPAESCCPGDRAALCPPCMAKDCCEPLCSAP